MRRAAGDETVLADHYAIGINAEDDGGEGARKINVNWRRESAVGCGGGGPEARAVWGRGPRPPVGFPQQLAWVHCPTWGRGWWSGWGVRVGQPSPRLQGA